MIRVEFEPNPSLEDEHERLFHAYNNSCDDDTSDEDFKKGFAAYLEQNASKELKAWLAFQKDYIAMREKEEADGKNQLIN